MEHLYTTICALATPPGEGGIATVRVSGPDAYGQSLEAFLRQRKYFGCVVTAVKKKQ